MNDPAATEPDARLRPADPDRDEGTVVSLPVPDGVAPLELMLDLIGHLSRDFHAVVLDVDMDHEFQEVTLRIPRTTSSAAS
ncbi:MAG TPA: hypothetical protein VGB19_02940 [Actinomycetota bacterium]